ncbi:alpha-L-arabinofuranosidase C-terminal domain-containing protein [Limisphaera sp. VF-2]|jgi:alpha-L-arabinofuranosidase|uniref:alpha-L-arabinofuranosidase C-terminal domain-containing protein n=1 Tax=Limisphaera sp. VF-2 TaxID=3400418 RepID=UPI0017552B37
MKGCHRILAAGSLLCLWPTFGGTGASPAVPPSSGTPSIRLTIDLRQPGKPISTNLIGVFFEDINYAADGGLYAELVQNRSFEYQPTARPDWTALTAWETVRCDGAEGSVVVADAFSIHPNNPHYVVLETRQPGRGFGLRNRGYDGIAVEAGKPYDFSLWGRQLFTGNRWGNSGVLDGPAEFTVLLQDSRDEVLASATVAIRGREWHRATATLVPSRSESEARLVLLSHTRGGVAVDEISLFPRATFKNRRNGLRADLAQAIADLKPRFVRFPGGCLVHGYGLNNMYRWPRTIGPVEQRRSQPNLWGYHQSMGLGYLEYFQFCEDIGAEPVPVVPAGVCCQNADHQGGTGQRGLPMEEMPAYVQEVLDLVEWAKGPPDSKWGSLRAAAGHPEPFHLKYIAVGNEEHITPVFRERFRMIYEALRRKHPEITVIGTVGPSHSGPDYDAGWAFADELRLPMVDEHYYVPPRWFWENLMRYDRYDRQRSRVYLGEYAAHDAGRRNTLRSALAEAAYLTSLERNGDVVAMASYAPLLGKRGRTQWNPNLIYFSNTQILRTINYYVQQLFSVHAGDTYLSATLAEDTTFARPSPAEDRVFLGTWDTQAEFDDVRLVVEGRTVVAEDFSGPTDRWEPIFGTWQLQNGVYQQQSRETPALSLLKAPAGASRYTFSLKARKTGGSEGFLIGFRYHDAQNYFWWNLGGWGNTRHAIEKATDGAKQQLGPERIGRIEPGRWYDLRVEVDGMIARCYLNGHLVQEIEDAGFRPPPDFAHSAVRDSATGDVILKWVNNRPSARSVQVGLPGLPSRIRATVIHLGHQDPLIVNDFDSPDRVVPQTNFLEVAENFAYTVPPYSLTVLRIPAR